jgi:hypothetical protein
MASVPTEDERTQVLNAYKAKVMEHREMESRCVAVSACNKRRRSPFGSRASSLHILQHVSP